MIIHTNDIVSKSSSSATTKRNRAKQMAIRKIHLDPLSSITIVWNRGSRIGRVSPSNFDRLINIWRRRYVKKKVRLRYILKNSLFFTAKNCQPLALSRRIFFFFPPLCSSSTFSNENFAFPFHEGNNGSSFFKK